MNSNSTHRDAHKKNECICPSKDIHGSIYSNLIPNSAKLMIQMDINKEIDKQLVMSSYREILQ